MTMITGHLTGVATGWRQIAANEKAAGRTNDELWRQVLEVGFPFLLDRQAESGSPGQTGSCVYCLRDFGPDVRRNRLNRYYCDDCDAFVRTTPGQTEVELPVLAVDIRSSTRIAHELGSEWVPRIRAFRDAVALLIQQRYGFVMNTAGDAVFAIFPPGFIPQSAVDGLDRASVQGRAVLNQLAASNAVAAASVLAQRGNDPTAGSMPFGTAVHMAPTLVFSAAGPHVSDTFRADSAEFDPDWMPADDSDPDTCGPVAIDIAGDGIVGASQLADQAPAGVALISRDTDRQAEQSTVANYETIETKAGPIDVRRF